MTQLVLLMHFLFLEWRNCICSLYDQIQWQSWICVFVCVYCVFVFDIVNVFLMFGMVQLHLFSL